MRFPALPPTPHLTLFLAAFLAAFLSRTSRADECDQLPPPSVTVKRLDERFSVTTQYGYRELNHLGSALAQRGQQVLGLTRGHAVARFTTRTPLYVDRSGQHECASPQLTLTLGFSPLSVYVAKEFPPGSCAYREIYEHELRHVKTYQAHLAGIEQDLLATLNRRFATGGPWRGPAGQTRARLQQELDERWLPYIQREIARGDDAQALIDTAEEYARVTQACDGEITKRIR